MSEQQTPYQAGTPERIRVECVGGHLWRIYSAYDVGAFIDLEAEGCRQLLDELLKIAGQFSDERPSDWKIRDR